MGRGLSGFLGGRVDLNKTWPCTVRIWSINTRSRDRSINTRSWDRSISTSRTSVETLNCVGSSTVLLSFLSFHFSASTRVISCIKTVVFYIYLDTFICLKFQSVQLDAFHVCVHVQKEREKECLCMCTEGKRREVGERRKGCVCGLF